MSRRNMKGVLLLASALSLGILGGVVSCTQKDPNTDVVPPSSDPWKDFVEDETITGLEISNIADLEIEWWIGDADRNIDVAITGPVTNLTQLMYENKLMAVSSNPDVVRVEGLKMQAVAAGSVTVTVKAGKLSKEIKVTTKQDALEIGGKYSLSEITSIPNTQKKWFKSEGVITGWTKGSDGQVYGNFSIAEDWAKGSTTFIVYGATGLTGEQGGSYTNSSGETINVDKVLSETDGTFAFNNVRDWLANENTKDLNVGDKISFDCIRCDYNGTIELSLWNVRFVEHGEFETAEEPDAVHFDSIEKVVAGTQEEAAAKKFTGNVKIKTIKKDDKYGNMFFEVPESLSNEFPKGLTVYGATATAGAITWDGVNEKYTYKNPKDFLTNDVTKALVVGQEIEVEMIRCDYTNNGSVTKKVFAYVKSVTPVTPTAITLSGEATVAKGSTITLTATTTPAAITVPLTWESSNTSVATVEGGVVTGVAIGKTTITAKYGDVVSAGYEVEVTNIIAPTAIVISGEGTVVAGSKITFTSEVTPTDYNVDLTWNSSNTEVATISEAGVLTGLKAGTTKVTLSYGSVVSNEIEVTVTASSKLEIAFTKDGKNTNLSKVSSYAKEANFTVEGVSFESFGNMTLPYGLKLGGNKITKTDRYVVNKTVFTSTVKSIAIQHGTKDKGADLNSLKLYVFDKVEDIADNDKAVYTYDGTYVDGGGTEFASQEGEDWTGKFLKINYNITVSGTTNAGVVLQSISYKFEL